MTHSKLYLAALLTLSLAPWAGSLAADYTVLVQPVLSQDRTRHAFQPLVDYLTRSTGKPFTLATSENFLKYSRQHADPAQADFVLDAAHFTGFRAQHRGYRVILKVGETISYSWVTLPEKGVLDLSELIAKPVAFTSAPSLAATWFGLRFPDAIRTPVPVSTDSAEQAIAALREGKVAAALIPTPMLNENNDLLPIEQSPSSKPMALSAAPTVSDSMVAKVRRALLNAKYSAKGKAMLRAVKLNAFEPSGNDEYAPYDKLLRFHWRQAGGKASPALIERRLRTLTKAPTRLNPSSQTNH